MLGSIIIDLAVACINTIVLQFAIPSKGIKYMKWQLLILFSEYICIDFAFLYNSTGKGQLYVFIVAAFVELMLQYINVWLWSKGNFWRNLIVVLLATAVANMIASLIVFAIKPLTPSYNAFSNYTDDIDTFAAICILAIFVIVSFGVAYLFSRIFTFDYRKKGEIYKIIAIVYNIMVLGVGITRKIFMDTNTSLVIVCWISLAFVSIIPLNILGPLYNKIESKRLLAESEKLKQQVKASTMQYIKLTASNEKLKEIRESTGIKLDEELRNADDIKKKYIEELTENIKVAGLIVCESITGNLYVDIALTEHEKLCKDEKIVLESTVDSSIFDKFQDVGISIFIDIILSIAENLSKAAVEDKTIVFSVRRVMEAAILKVEFTKNVSEKLNKRIVNKLMKNQNSKTFETAFELYYPKLIIHDTGDIGTISIVLENMEK